MLESSIQPNLQDENKEEDKNRSMFRFINRDTVPGRSTGLYCVGEFRSRTL